MAERRILQLGDPLLRQVCRPVQDLASPDLSGLITDLDDTLAAFRRRTGHGRGIAAPQIGVLRRVLFVRMIPEGFCGALIHPEITESSQQTIELWDDCFSFPDLLVRVRRSAWIEIRYLDGTGADHRIRAEGPLSELLQHEIDHLDGILAVDRAIDRNAFITRAEWERIGRPA